MRSGEKKRKKMMCEKRDGRGGSRAGGKLLVERRSNVT